MAVSVKAGAVFDTGAPVELFRFDSAVIDYDVSPDGQRFIASQSTTLAAPSISIVVNWPAVLKQKPPSGGS
jgi:hypothetical protein